MIIQKVTKYCLFLFTTFFVGWVDAIAQAPDTVVYKTRLFQINIDFINTTGAFARDIRNDAIGISASWLFQTKIDGAFFLGPAIDWHRYQSITNVNLNTQDRISTDDVSVLAHFRYYPNTVLGPLELYIDGFLGPRAFYSPVSFTDLNTAEQIDFRLEEVNLGLSYGVGAGVSINLTEYLYFINLGAHYMSGTSFRFLAPEIDGSGTPTNDVLIRNARYDAIKYYLGFSMSF